MNNDTTTPKSGAAEQPAVKGLDGAACSPSFCRYCGYQEATQKDWDSIPVGEGSHLCWGQCLKDAEAALDRVIKERDKLKSYYDGASKDLLFLSRVLSRVTSEKQAAISIAQRLADFGDPKPWKIDEWQKAKSDLLENAEHIRPDTTPQSND